MDIEDRTKSILQLVMTFLVRAFKVLCGPLTLDTAVIVSLFQGRFLR